MWEGGGVSFIAKRRQIQLEWKKRMVRYFSDKRICSLHDTLVCHNKGGQGSIKLNDKDLLLHILPETKVLCLSELSQGQEHSQGHPQSRVHSPFRLLRNGLMLKYDIIECPSQAMFATYHL